MTEELKQLEKILGIRFEAYQSANKQQMSFYRNFQDRIYELSICGCVIPPNVLAQLAGELRVLTLINCRIDSVSDLYRLEELEELSLDNVIIEHVEKESKAVFAYSEDVYKRASLSLSNMSVEHLAAFVPLAGNSPFLDFSINACTIRNFYEINLFPGLYDLDLTDVRIHRSENDVIYPEPAGGNFNRLSLYDMELDDLNVFVPVCGSIREINVQRSVIRSIREIYRFPLLKKLKVDAKTQIGDNDPGLYHDSFVLETCTINHFCAEKPVAFDLQKLVAIAPYIKGLEFDEYVRHKPASLKHFTRLEKLEFLDSSVTLRDFLPVAHQIKTLLLNQSELNVSKSLAKFTKLEEIEILNYNRKRLRGLARLLPLKHQLKKLEISEDDLKNTGVISEFTQLESLEIKVNSVKSARAILNLGSLKKLWLRIDLETEKTITLEFKALTNIRELLLSTTNNVNLKGLAPLQELRKLWLECNCKTDELHLLEKLEYLDLTLGGRLDINRIPVMKSVKTLRLETGGSKIHSLEHFPNLENLKIHTDADTLSIGKLEKLRVLVISFFHVENMDCFGQLPTLEQLELCYNERINLQNLGQLTNLKMLDLMGNELTDLKGLENLKNLEYLNLFENKVSDVRILNRLPKLKQVNLAMNDIDEEDILEQLEHPEKAIFLYRPYLPFSINVAWD